MPYSYSLHWLAAALMLATLITYSAPAEEPPFSLGGPERVKEILSKYEESPLPPALNKPGTKLKSYAQPDSMSSAPTRTFILQGSEIVAECILFMDEERESLTECETVQTAVPWAAKKWQEGTIKLGHANADTPGDPLYTVTRPGWAAEVFSSWNIALLAIVKQGIPGLNIDDLIPGVRKKELLQKPDPNMPFTLGGPERVAKVLSKYKEGSWPTPLGPRLKYYEDTDLPPRMLKHGVILHESEIVAECTTFMQVQEPLTQCETIRTAVPWAGRKWTKGTVKAGEADDTPDMPLYTATRPGWAARACSHLLIAQLVVVKQGTPGLSVDDLMPVNPLKEPQKDIRAKVDGTRQERKAFDHGK